MTLEQLRLYLDQLVAGGADPKMLVCVADDGRAVEIDSAMLLLGPHVGDPSPRMGGLPVVDDKFLLFTCAGLIDLDPLLQTVTVLDAPEESAEVLALEPARFQRVWKVQ